MIAPIDGGTTQSQQPQQRPIAPPQQANVNRIPSVRLPQMRSDDPSAPITPPTMSSVPGLSQGGSGAGQSGMPSTPTIAPVTASSAGMPATPSVASLPTTPTSSFGPGNDLRTTQINPVADPRLASTQGQVDQTANKLANGPDRFQIAQDRFNTFAQQTDPQFQADLRSATQKAAANGTIGSGMLGTDYGNLELARERQLSGERQGIFQNALEGTIGDTRANVGLLAGLEGQQFDQGAQARNELRGERGFQVGQEDQAYQRRRQGVMDQDYLTNSDFGRNLARTQVGEAGNPASLYAGVGGYQGDQAARQRSQLTDAIYNQQVQAPTGPATASPLLNAIDLGSGGINANGIPSSIMPGAWNPYGTPRSTPTTGIPGGLLSGVNL